MSKNNSNYTSALQVPRVVPPQIAGKCKMVTFMNIHLEWANQSHNEKYLWSAYFSSSEPQCRFTNIAPHGDLSYAPVLPATTMPPLADPAVVVVHPPQSEDFGT